MLNNKDVNQAGELSECLDDCNDGRQFITQDEEIKELVEMANLVKQSYSQKVVPQLLIADFVDNLAAELKIQKKQQRRTYWLYGGLVGTAAAVLIAAFIQLLLPQSTNNNIAQQFDDSMQTQETVAVADQSSEPIVTQKVNAMIRQPVQSGSSGSPVGPIGQSVEKKAIDDRPKVIAKIIQVSQSPKMDEKPDQVAILQQEIPKAMMKISQFAGNTSIVVLPNQVAQSITVDNKSGTIRQVYNQGTNDEIIITQHLLDESMTKTQDDSKHSVVQLVDEPATMKTNNKDNKNSVNSLTVKVDKYYIMIEGKKTKEDLQKIAESLLRINGTR